ADRGRRPRPGDGESTAQTRSSYGTAGGRAGGTSSRTGPVVNPENRLVGGRTRQRGVAMLIAPAVGVIERGRRKHPAPRCQDLRDLRRRWHEILAAAILSPVAAAECLVHRDDVSARYARQLRCVHCQANPCVGAAIAELGTARIGIETVEVDISTGRVVGAPESRA